MGGEGRGGEEGFSLAVCHIDEGGLDRVNKTPGISPYRTPAEKWISVYLFRRHFSRGSSRDTIVSVPNAIGCQKQKKKTKKRRPQEAEGYK